MLAGVTLGAGTLVAGLQRRFGPWTAVIGVAAAAGNVLAPAVIKRDHPERIALVTAYRHIGHSVPRLHAPVSRRGQDLVDDLVSAVALVVEGSAGNGEEPVVADVVDPDGAPLPETAPGGDAPQVGEVTPEPPAGGVEPEPEGDGAG